MTRPTLASLALAGAALLACTAVRAKEPDKAAAPGRRLELSVTDKGFEPNTLKVKKGEPLTLVVTRRTDHTCAKTIVIKEPQLRADLPLNKAVEVSFTPQKTGELKYGCAMGQMVSGILVVE